MDEDFIREVINEAYLCELNLNGTLTTFCKRTRNGWRRRFGIRACDCVVLLCCCFRFRIPRTKQEIEADYHRRKIVKKFRKRIQKFENAEMDAEMDLQKDFMKETHKSSDPSSGSDNDESNYDDKKTGARKKKLQAMHNKKDQLIQTIYTGNYGDEAHVALEPNGN